MALWIDQLFHSSITKLSSHTNVYDGAFIITTVVGHRRILWLGCNWFITKLLVPWLMMVRSCLPPAASCASVLIRTYRAGTPRDERIARWPGHSSPSHFSSCLRGHSCSIRASIVSHLWTGLSLASRLQLRSRHWSPLRSSHSFACVTMARDSHNGVRFFFFICPFSVVVSRTLTPQHYNSILGTEPLQRRLWTRSLPYRGDRKRVEIWCRPRLDIQGSTSWVSEGRPATRDNGLILATGLAFLTIQGHIQGYEGKAVWYSQKVAYKPIEWNHWSQHIVSSVISRWSTYIFALVLSYCAISDGSTSFFVVYYY